MKLNDFAEYLVKLDRNKASIGPKSRNSPVWEIESTTNTTHAISEVTIMMYVLGAGIKWDGKWQWDGKAQWGDG